MVRLGLFSLFTSITTKAVQLIHSSSIKTLASSRDPVFNGQGAIARATDGGANWSTSFFNQLIQGVDFPTTDIGFAVGLAGTILNTADSGVTWRDQISGTSANLNDVSFASDALRGIAVGDTGMILCTANGGAIAGLQGLRQHQRAEPLLRRGHAELRHRDLDARLP